jgi:hypothetical protein
MVHQHGIDLVEVEDLIKIKQTKRIRDYPIIGALAEVAGWQGEEPTLALQYLQDFILLEQAVKKWPEAAKNTGRPAVQGILEGKGREEIAAIIAQEQVRLMQKDEERISAMEARLEKLYPLFSEARGRWNTEKTGLPEQHVEMQSLARCLLDEGEIL